MRTIDVITPTSGAVVGQVDDMDADAVAKLVDRARQAQPEWEAFGASRRVAVLRRVRRSLVARRAEARDVLVAESGKAWEDAQADLVLTITGMAHHERHVPGLIADQKLPTPGVFGLGRSATMVYRPHGVVGVIGPWNFPLGLTFADAVPALIAGNTVVLKPSEVTPLSTLWIAEVFAEAARLEGAPDDVVVVATGTGPTGAALVDEVDMVQFTGSVGTGQRIAHACVDRNIPYSLELGGKDPWIVLADADLDRAAAAAAHYGLYNGGQVCMSVERIYVEESVHDAFVDKLVDRVRSLRPVEAGGGPGTADVAPMIGPGQGGIVADHVADALAKGAVARTGGAAGRPDRPAATVLTGVDHDMAVMREETFGPVLPVMAVRDADQAVTLANDSIFGLTASIWTSDVARGQALARRVNAATVSINDAHMHLALPHLPMGGQGASGTGARNGVAGTRKYVRGTVVVTNRLPAAAELLWVPYRKASSVIVDKAIGLLFRR